MSAFDTLREKTNQLDAGVLYRRGSVAGSVAMFVNDISDFILIESNYAKSTTPMGGNTMGGGSMGGGDVGRDVPAWRRSRGTSTPRPG